MHRRTCSSWNWTDPPAVYKLRKDYICKSLCAVNDACALLHPVRFQRASLACYLLAAHTRSNVLPLASWGMREAVTTGSMATWRGLEEFKAMGLEFVLCLPEVTCFDQRNPLCDAGHWHRKSNDAIRTCTDDTTTTAISYTRVTTL